MDIVGQQWIKAILEHYIIAHVWTKIFQFESVRPEKQEIQLKWPNETTVVN